jgi:hypothetical protein
LPGEPVLPLGFGRSPRSRTSISTRVSLYLRQHSCRLRFTNPYHYPVSSSALFSSCAVLVVPTPRSSHLRSRYRVTVGIELKIHLKAALSQAAYKIITATSTCHVHRKEKSSGLLPTLDNIFHRASKAPSTQMKDTSKGKDSVDSSAEGSNSTTYGQHILMDPFISLLIISCPPDDPSPQTDSPIPSKENSLRSSSANHSVSSPIPKRRGSILVAAASSLGADASPYASCPCP